MDLQQFEQAILKLAFETDARITTASVAYYLGIPSRDATNYLNNLLEEGVLELDSDPSGNLFYRVPNLPSEGDGAIQKLRKEQKPDRSRPSASHFTTSLDGDGTDEPVAVSYGAPPARQGAPRPAPSRPEPVAHGEWRGGPIRRTEPKRLQADVDGAAGRGSVGDSRSAGAVVRPNWSVAAARVASPDASLDNCGSSRVILSTSRVRCEPKPLPASKPMLVSCSDTPARDAQREQMWFGRPAESTALVEAGETALARDYYIEQPEHQPGMALLLSLILPGTGQIYNGELSKGIIMMVLSFLLWFVLLGWVVHIWSIVDAVVVAERLNRKQA